MATMLGRFEIQNELSKSETAAIYKALDTESGQIVALKTQSLAPLGDRAAEFVQSLMEEGEHAVPLNSQNIAVLYGAGEIEGQLCAAMEYVEGNSIATMLARGDSFSIWDLLDVTRQVCTALEQAEKTAVVHSSLEPGKIVVQWDGLVKVLGYGISRMSLARAETGNGLGRLMPYCSPEQIQGAPIDGRSVLFTLGAILYEMVLGRRAFEATAADALRSQIQQEMPAEPMAVNPKITPALNALIMKALAKDPAARYATARELVEDLENCRNSRPSKWGEQKKDAAETVKADPVARAAAAGKFASAASASAGGTSQTGSFPSGRQQDSHRASSRFSGLASHAATQKRVEFDPAPDARLNQGFYSQNDHRNAGAGTSTAGAVMRAATGQAHGTQSSGIAVDPLMAPGSSTAQSGARFSDLDELPPLGQPAPEPAPADAGHSVEYVAKPSAAQNVSSPDERTGIQARELARKTMHEIATVPPRLLLFSILGAIAVILVVSVALFLHVHSEDASMTAAPQAVKPQAVAPQAAQAAPPVSRAEVTAAAKPVPAPAADIKPTLTVRQIGKRDAKKQQAQKAPAPAVIVGEAFIDSSPQGVEFQLDGKSDPAWVTPFTLTGLGPGKHIVAASKAGYTTEIRSFDVAAGGKSFVAFHLTAINALVVVTSTPAGAEITIDGKPTKRVTPAQFAVEKGTHTLLVRKDGFLDETMTADVVGGQTFTFAPALRALGNSEEIRTVGKLKKLFGNVRESATGTGLVSIHTRPKGAQVIINQRTLDKMSPVDVTVAPGNYVVDITLTGFKPIHKVITIETGGRAVLDEILERQ